MSIIEYLEETRPSPPLLPKDPLKRSQARTLALIIGADIQPVQVSYFYSYDTLSFSPGGIWLIAGRGCAAEILQTHPLIINRVYTQALYYDW